MGVARSYRLTRALDLYAQDLIDRWQATGRHAADKRVGIRRADRVVALLSKSANPAVAA